MAGLTIATGELALGVIALPAGRLSAYLFACAAATAALAVGVRRLFVPPPDDPGEGRGGIGTPSDDPPPPPWWPEFEASFREHVRARERPHVRVRG